MTFVGFLSSIRSGCSTFFFCTDCRFQKSLSDACLRCNSSASLICRAVDGHPSQPCFGAMEESEPWTFCVHPPYSGAMWSQTADGWECRDLESFKLQHSRRPLLIVSMISGSSA